VALSHSQKMWNLRHVGALEMVRRIERHLFRSAEWSVLKVLTGPLPSHKVGSSGFTHPLPSLFFLSLSKRQRNTSNLSRFGFHVADDVTRAFSPSLFFLVKSSFAALFESHGLGRELRLGQAASSLRKNVQGASCLGLLLHFLLHLISNSNFSQFLNAFWFEFGSKVILESHEFDFRNLPISGK
jgi:hypothetical protein